MATKPTKTTKYVYGFEGQNVLCYDTVYTVRLNAKGAEDLLRQFTDDAVIVEYELVPRRRFKNTKITIEDIK